VPNSSYYTQPRARMQQQYEFDKIRHLLLSQHKSVGWNFHFQAETAIMSHIKILPRDFGGRISIIIEHQFDCAL
jgi:hypothetical protein